MALPLVTRCCSIGTPTAIHCEYSKLPTPFIGAIGGGSYAVAHITSASPYGRHQEPDLRGVGQRHPRRRLRQARLAVMRRSDDRRLGRHDHPLRFTSSSP